MRGEHDGASREKPHKSGSSPHARGARTLAWSSMCPAGITPACAGSTPRSRAPQRCRQDHPRMRGEHRLDPGPRGRRWDHPRMRGEHKGSRVYLQCDWGSSPHARETPIGTTGGLLTFGIIPACAGSTCRGTSRPHLAQDHPRMRGEHYASSRIRATQAGSSPHARGARYHADHPHPHHGIIPACAGSTRRLGGRDGAPGDHPRMRGEHALTLGRKQAGAGSSPHARGAPHGLSRSRCSLGIIPACAGSTGRTC